MGAGRRRHHHPVTPLLALAGVRSFQGYEHGMRACRIDLDVDEPGLVIRPQQPDREYGRVDVDGVVSRMPAAVSDTDLGEAVRHGISLSIGWPSNSQVPRKDHFRPEL